MYKIGNDIVLISRIEKSIKSPSFLNKVFTENERLDIEICHNDNGKPYFKGIDNCDLSISHDGDYAIATVIMW